MKGLLTRDWTSMKYVFMWYQMALKQTTIYVEQEKKCKKEMLIGQFAQGLQAFFVMLHYALPMCLFTISVARRRLMKTNALLAHVQEA